MKRINKLLVSVFVLVCAGQTAAYAALADDDGLIAGGAGLVGGDPGLAAGGGAYGMGGGSGLIAGGGSFSSGGGGSGGGNGVFNGANGLVAGGGSGGGNGVFNGGNGLVAGGGSYGNSGGNLIASAGGIGGSDGLVSGDSGTQMRRNGLTGSQTEFADEQRTAPRFGEPRDVPDNEAVATLLPRNHTIRINNLANIEVLLRLVGNGLEILGLTFGVPAIISGAMHFNGTHEGTMKKILTGFLAVIGGLATPGLINWFVASSCDANLFS